MSYNATDRLWDFAVTAYGKPGVADLCLQAQDLHGYDVNMLLYAAWCAGEGRVVSEAHWRQLDELLEPWRAAVVRPLREQRRQWGEQSDDDAPHPLYEHAKAVELEAERQQLAVMSGYADGLTESDGSLAELLGQSFGVLCAVRETEASELTPLLELLSSS